MSGFQKVGSLVAPMVQQTPLARLMHAISEVATRLPGDTVGRWADALAPAMRSSGISTPRRIAAFLGQVSVESGGFLDLEEDLNYSAERLCAVWPSRFIPGSTLSNSCARNPELLGNYVYADRLGNGDDTTGDGYAFRGRGLIQITGRSNYEAFAKSVGKPVADVVNWCATMQGASMSSCWFWATHSLNTPAEAWNHFAITRAINGGTEGLEQRRAASEIALKALG